MINSSLAAIIGLALAIVLIIKKISPVYSLMIGALAGGFLGCGSLVGTVSEMFEGVKSITPAILRILAAGVLYHGRQLWRIAEERLSGAGLPSR